jgi:hypothetical protein
MKKNRFYIFYGVVFCIFLSGCVKQSEHDAVIQERDDLAKQNAELLEKVKRFDAIMLRDQIRPRISRIEDRIVNGEYSSAQRELAQFKIDFPNLGDDPRIKGFETRIARALEAEAAKPVYDMDMPDFWRLIHESDNNVRNKELYDGKTVKIRAILSSVISGKHLVLETGYEYKYVSAIAPDESLEMMAEVAPRLESKMVISVQGRFDLQRKWIEEAVVLNPSTGKPLLVSEIASLQRVTEEDTTPKTNTAFVWWNELRGKTMSHVRNTLGTPFYSSENDTKWGYPDRAISKNSGRKEVLTIYFRGGIVKGVTSDSLDMIYQDTEK